jgi:hypothetical protein
LLLPVAAAVKDKVCVMVSVAVWLAPPAVAVIVAVVAAFTLVVLTGNVALTCPAGTVTLAGTVAAGLLLESVTTTPPAGA